MSTNTVQLKPIGFRVLAEKEVVKEVRGIILPENTETAKMVVIEVGESKFTDAGQERKIPVKPGDRILVEKYASQEPIEIDGKEYVIVKADDIVAVFN